MLFITKPIDEETSGGNRMEILVIVFSSLNVTRCWKSYWNNFHFFELRMPYSFIWKRALALFYSQSNGVARLAPGYCGAFFYFHR